MDALQLLRDDHRRVRDLFRQFEEANDASTRKAIVDEAVAELMVHAQLEEEIFYPAMEREGMSDLIDHAEEEHHAAENIMNELFDMGAGDRELEPKFRVLMDTVNEHVTEEESQIFPRAAEIGMDRLERIGDQLQELRNRIMSTPATERRRPQRRAAASRSRSRTSTSGRSTSARSRSTSSRSSTRTRASITRSTGSRSTGRARSGSASTTGGRTATSKRTGTGRSTGTRSTTSRTGTRSSAGTRSTTGRAASTSRTRSGTSRSSAASSRSSRSSSARPSSRSGGTRSSGSRTNGRSGVTKEQLYERAQAAGIEGRSTMNKQQLQRALARNK